MKEVKTNMVLNSGFNNKASDFTEKVGFHRERHQELGLSPAKFCFDLSWWSYMLTGANWDGCSCNPFPQTGWTGLVFDSTQNLRSQRVAHPQQVSSAPAAALACTPYVAAEQREPLRLDALDLSAHAETAVPGRVAESLAVSAGRDLSGPGAPRGFVFPLPRSHFLNVVLKKNAVNEIETNTHR